MRHENLRRLDSLNLSKRNATYLVYKYLFSDIKNAVEKYAKGSVLDIGCGNKPYRQLFKNIDKYVGCDIIQSSNNEVDVICEAIKIPIEDESFDTVFSTQTIEHVFEHEQMLKEAYRLLKTDGYLIVTGPMYWPHHEEPFDFFRFTKYGFEELLKKTGFEVIEINPNGGKWALWGIVTLHTLPRRVSELKITKWIINTLCYHLDTKYPDYKNTTNFLIVGRKSNMK